MSSTPANHRKGNNNSQSADRRQFSDLIEGLLGRAGHRALGGLGLGRLVAELCLGKKETISPFSLLACGVHIRRDR